MSQSLTDKLLKLFEEKGSFTTIDMYEKFKDYKHTSFPAAMHELRGRGYKITKKVVGITKGAQKRALIRYTLHK